VLKLAAGLVVLALLAAGCGDDTARLDSSTDVAGDWVLVEGRGPEGEVAMREGHDVTLTFEEDESQLGGTSPCNHYGGQYTLEGDRLSISELYQTEMACDPPEIMDAERIYLGAMAAVERAQREGDGLVLSGPDTELRYRRLEPEPDAELTGTTWELDTLLEGSDPDSAASSPMVGPRGTLVIDADGTFTGSTGCRDLTGTIAADGDGVRIASLEVAGECDGELQTQDATIVDVLGRGPTGIVEGPTLTFTAPDGSGIIYRAGEAS
jgi:heat shock protein HslJ